MGKRITTIYVTFDERRERTGTTRIAQLGLYSPKSNKKKARNGRQRMYSYGWRHTLLADGNVSVNGRVVAPHLKPQFIENIPLHGFKIVGFETTGRANKVWRVRDPRGFDVIVPTSSIAKIISSCTIEEGYIAGPCVWYFGKEGCGSPTIVPATIIKA